MPPSNRPAIAVIANVTLSLATVCAMAANSAESGVRAPSDQPAWEWSDAERIAVRIDDAAAASRARTSRNSISGGAAAMTAAGDDLPYDVIVGSRDPHLFFRYELFDQMMKMAFADKPKVREAYRGSKEQHRRQLGLPPDMWARLEAIASPYLIARREQRSFDARRAEDIAGEMPDDAWHVAACRARFTAMNEAEQQLGPSFTRFLYTAVSSGMVQMVLRKPDHQVIALAKRECR